MAPTSARTPIWSPSGSPTRSTSAAGASRTTRSTRWTSCARWASNLVQPRRPRPRDRPAPRAAARGRRAAHARDRRPAARVRRARARARARPTTPLRTYIRSGGRWHAFQEFMIRDQGPAGGRRVPRRARAAATPEALEAIREARAIIIGPSNPVLSIDPILCVLGDAIRAADGAGRGRLADRARPGPQGPDGRLPRLGRPDAGHRRDRRPLRGPDRRRSSPISAPTSCRRWRPTSSSATPSRAGAWPPRCSSSPPR